MSYLDYFSFANGIQNGYLRNNYPRVSDSEYEIIFSKILKKLCSSYDFEQDILCQFLRGEIDRWEAVDALEEELGLSYDEATKKILDFQRQHGIKSSPDSKKRKKSKYNGALVNNTFDSAPGGGSVGGLAVASSGLKSHPSIRYMAVTNMVHPTKRHLVLASLSGSMDTLLYQTYASVANGNMGNIEDVGDNGRVVLNFDSDSGHSTEVDLGGHLDTGYVVQSINDELGLFPDGTVEGDLLETKVVQDVIREQARGGAGV